MFNDVFFWLFIAFPIISALAMLLFLPKKFTWVEMIAQVTLCTVLVLVFWMTTRYGETSDVETWNGEISQKSAVRQDCPYGWHRNTDDFCTNYHTRSVYDGQICTTSGTGKNKTRSCRPSYHTEYQYYYAWEQRYFLKAQNISREWEIPRVDPQGANNPPRFAEVNVGDPASTTNVYTNWIKAASDSIFHEDLQALERYEGKFPTYPNKIYDIYKIDRVIQTAGLPQIDLNSWNLGLDNILKKLGPEKQMNAIIVMADAANFQDDYSFAVRRAWQGFKKNDAVIFLGLDQTNSIKWVNVLSWSKDELFNVKLRNDLLSLRGSPIDQNKVLNFIYTDAIATYVRRPMSDFEFLKDSIPVPMMTYILAFAFGVLGSLGLSYLFYRIDLNEVFSVLTSR